MLTVKEIQDYAKVMYELVKPHVPIAAEAFEDYSLNSISLSRMEVDVLQYVLSYYLDCVSFLTL